LQKPSEAFRQAMELAWTPFERVSQIKVSVSEKINTNTSQNKRVRLYKEEEHYFPPIATDPLTLMTPTAKIPFGETTYASATNSGGGTNISSITHQITLPTKLTTRSESLTNDKVTILKETVRTLQNNMKILAKDTKNKIEILNDKTNNKMDNMNKNIEHTIEDDKNDTLYNPFTAAQVIISKQQKIFNNSINCNDSNQPDFKKD
jgi:hypothetical protein